jgi:hypothetical protein
MRRTIIVRPTSFRDLPAASAATTVKHSAGGQFVTHAAALPGNPFDRSRPGYVSPGLRFFSVHGRTHSLPMSLWWAYIACGSSRGCASPAAVLSGNLHSRHEVSVAAMLSFASVGGPLLQRHLLFARFSLTTLSDERGAVAFLFSFATFLCCLKLLGFAPMANFVGTGSGFILNYALR